MWGRTAVLAAALSLGGCAGFRAVDRAEWVRVYADSADRSSHARQEVITKDRFEAEAAAGHDRRFEPLTGWHPPFLHDTETIGVELGDVVELLVDESHDARVELSGNACQVYLTPVHKRDEWRDGTDVTHVEAELYLVGLKPGTATLRLVTPQVTKDIPVIVGN